MAIYFLIGADHLLTDDICKIGYMGNASGSRIQNVKTSCPFSTDLLWSIDELGKDAEKELHRLFAEDRITREWFRFTDELEETAENVFFAVTTFGAARTLRRLKSSETAEDFNTWVHAVAANKPISEARIDRAKATAGERDAPPE